MMSRLLCVLVCLCSLSLCTTWAIRIDKHPPNTNATQRVIISHNCRSVPACKHMCNSRINPNISANATSAKNSTHKHKPSKVNVPTKPPLVPEDDNATSHADHCGQGCAVRSNRTLFECIDQCNDVMMQSMFPKETTKGSTKKSSKDSITLLKEKRAREATGVTDKERRANYARYIIQLCSLGCQLRCPPIRQDTATPDDPTVPLILR